MTPQHNHQGQFSNSLRVFLLGISLGLWGSLTDGALLSSGLLRPFDDRPYGVVAAELPGGISFFAAPPRLLDSATTFSDVSIPGAKYYFTIALPDNAGRSLAKVVFQRQDSPDPIDFEVNKTQAFEGNRQNLGQDIALNPTEFNRATGQLTVSFVRPIAPGETVTIRLKPVQNPDVPGVYQFRLWAVPTGDNAQSMDLGVARLQFYRGIF
ncbi:MAG: hypothetical protein RLZZ568_278 [Cyanobacteriota bacterium]|jgi:hypothetical protein